MAAMANATFRLVRCPKCLSLLPEIAEFPIYICGCCSAILQSEIRYSSEQIVHVAPSSKSDSSNAESFCQDLRIAESGESLNAASFWQMWRRFSRWPLSPRRPRCPSSVSSSSATYSTKSSFKEKRSPKS